MAEHRPSYRRWRRTPARSRGSVVGCVGMLALGGLWLLTQSARADEEPPELLVDDVVVGEGGTATIEVSLDRPLAAGERVEVVYETVSETADDPASAIPVPRTSPPTTTAIDPTATSVPSVVAPGADDLAEPQDYDARSGAIDFTPGGPTTATVTVPTRQDDEDETDEHIVVAFWSTYTEVGTPPSPTTTAPPLPSLPSLPTLPAVTMTSIDPENPPTTPPPLPSTSALPTITTPTTTGVPDDEPPVAVHLREPRLAVVTVEDDDGPAVTIAGPGPAPEGDEDVTLVPIEIVLSAPSPQDVTVHVQTTDGPDAIAASSPGDYGELDTRITIENGETAATVDLTIAGDLEDETDEIVYVDLVEVEDGEIAGGRAAVTIDDDDGPAVSVADVSVVEGTGGAATAVFPLTLSSASPQDVEVEYVTIDGTATTPADYAEVRTIATIAAGEQAATIEIPLATDPVEEDDETFDLSVYRADDGELPADGARATATILDDDAPLPVDPATEEDDDETEPGGSTTAGGDPASGGLPLPATSTAKGYWMVGADGGVFAFGDAPFLGSLGGQRLNAPVVGAAATPEGDGYWMAAADGGVFAFGDAPFLGSTGGLELRSPIVAITATPTGLGYWLVAADGGVFAFGDAPFLGSTGGVDLRSPIVGMATTPDGDGYWLAAADGGVFTFGRAPFLGSMAATPLRTGVVGIDAHGDDGYWLVGLDGGVFAFGDAPFLGSPAALPLAQPVVSFASVATNDGYWLTAADGGLFTYGRAPFMGSAATLPRSHPVVGLALFAPAA